MAGTVATTTRHGMRGSLTGRCVLAIFFAFFPLLQNVTFAQEDTGYELNVTPKICVVHGSESPCMLVLDIAWSAPGNEDLCLRLRGAESPLECWRQRREGRLELEHASAANVVLQLTQEQTGAVLQQAEVKVVTRSLRDSRRRRRHVWSIL